MDFEKAKRLLIKYTNAKRKGDLEQQVLIGVAKVAESRENRKEAEVRQRELLKLFEAQKLYEQVKDAKIPETSRPSPPAKTP